MGVIVGISNILQMHCFTNSSTIKRTVSLTLVAQYTGLETVTFGALKDQLQWHENQLVRLLAFLADFTNQIRIMWRLLSISY